MNKQQQKRLNEIEQEAISNFLDKCDFDMCEWIDYANNYPEYKKLYQLKYNICPQCQNKVCECE